MPQVLAQQRLHHRGVGFMYAIGAEGLYELSVGALLEELKGAGEV